MCLANKKICLFLKQKGANIMTSSISFKMIEQTDILKELKNDKAVTLDNEQTNGDFNHSKFKSHIFNR